MIEPKVPEDEAKRVAALNDLNVFYTPAEERFDRVTRLARRLFNTPIALVSLVDSTRQWFKSADGLSATETPREVSFCGHAILGDEVMVVPDARKDERFVDNPLVTGDPHIRFYAGYPLNAPDGSKIGTLCLIDREPREFGGSDVASLRDLGAMVEEELMMTRLSRAQRELVAERDAFKRKAMIDPLTRLWNREAIMDILARELAMSGREKTPLGVVMGDLDLFKTVNDTHGHQAGDEALRETARRIRSSVRHQDAVGRYGGEEFLLVLPSTDLGGVADMAERVRVSVSSEKIHIGERKIPLTISLGAALGRRGLPEAVELVAAADRALYAAKNDGRNCVRMAG